uniref:Uncharacterized protein n=1 Tax=Adineta vaga TaxID=104782 RepID=B3G4J7_ADIVA|nr:unknown [Adineta vaga]
MSITETVTNTDDENKQSFTWVDFLTQLDRSLSGDLYNVCYNIINIGLLCIGFYYGLTTCRAPGVIAVVSLFIIIFNINGFIYILFFVKRCSCHQVTLSDEEKDTRDNVDVCMWLHFGRLLSICAGTVCIFITPQRSPYNDCEIARFFLGIVCMNTWFLDLIWPRKPSLPSRRSLTLECLILLFWIIITGIYFNFVIFALIETKSYDCIYTHIEDLLFRAPLRSFAGIGLILNGFTLVLRIANAILNQLFYRLPKYRKIFIRLSAIDYALSYLMTMVMTYYYSLGVVLLFQPRSGCSCRTAAPDLYQTLFVWELLRLFAPFTTLLLVRFVSCFGTLCVTCLGHCLPVSIIVPLFEALMVCFIFIKKNFDIQYFRIETIISIFSITSYC